MAGFAKSERRFAQPSAWFDQIAALLARELAPNSRKLRCCASHDHDCHDRRRPVASCHVNNELGTYIVWLLVGAGPMMSLRKACAFLIAEAIALCGAVVMAGMLVEVAVAHASVSSSR